MWEHGGLMGNGFQKLWYMKCRVLVSNALQFLLHDYYTAVVSIITLTVLYVHMAKKKFHLGNLLHTERKVACLFVSADFTLIYRSVQLNFVLTDERVDGTVYRVILHNYCMCICWWKCYAVVKLSLWCPTWKQTHFLQFITICVMVF